MTTAVELESRIVDLEVKLTFNEEMLEQLNRVLYLQQLQIDRMEKELQALREQVRDSQPAQPRNLRDEIPPHY